MADQLKVPSSKSDVKRTSSKQRVSSKSSLSSRSQVRSRSKLAHGSRLRNASKLSFRDGEDDGWMAAKDPVKPEDQLELTAEEMKQEFTRILRADNPYAPDNIVSFSFKEREFRQTSTVEQMSMHFSMDGNVLHKDSDEARRQNARNKKGRRRAPAVDAGTGPDESEDKPEEKPEGEDAGEVQAEGEEEGEEVTEGEQEDSGEAAAEPEEEEAEGPKKPLRNQFNYSERASQTFNHTTKERGVATDPPPRATFSGVANQWMMYDAYVKDYAAKQAANTKNKKGNKEDTTKEPVKAPVIPSEDGGSGWSAAGRVVKLPDAKKLERMVYQNSSDEVIQDYAYYDDPSDAFKEGEGSVLPLWKFSNERTKKTTVTAISWNPQYRDMFAVGIGSYDFTKQAAGAVAVYSLKNPSHPEILLKTISGVMSLDFHPEHPSLLAVGLYDGTVQVHDLSLNTREEPLFKSTAKTGKHTDPVWQIKWQPDDLDKNRNFYTVSSDGRVTCWTLVKTELQYLDVIKLKLDDTQSANPGDDQSLFGFGSGTCFAFSKSNHHLFLVGTEEGKVHKCSKAYSSKFVKTFDAHTMAVYAIVWNPFHEDVFLTCSADWMVRIWDQTCDQPLFSFDLGNPVGSVAWAPYSSTVFSAITTDGKIHVYDLSQNKYEALCQQQMLRKSKPTHLAFNQDKPVVLVGDDRGAVTCLKLSPNLRKAMKDKKMKTPEAQLEAINKVLDSVKET